MPQIRSNDAVITYEEMGDGSPLLMLMGFSSDARTWVLQTPAFAQRHRCIMPNNRGVGGSTMPGGECSLDQMAEDALAVLDASGIERAHVLGVSMGGAIAQHLALRAPHRVRSLTLAVTWAGRNAYTELVSAFGRAAITLDPAAIVNGLMLFTFTPAFLIGSPEMAAGIERLMLDYFATGDVFLAQMRALLEHEVRALLPSITAPTRVLVARRDQMVPPELGREIARLIAGSDLIELASGHACNIEEYQAFNSAVLEFLAQH